MAGHTGLPGVCGDRAGLCGAEVRGLTPRSA